MKHESDSVGSDTEHITSITGSKAIRLRKRKSDARSWGKEPEESETSSANRQEQREANPYLKRYFQRQTKVAEMRKYLETQNMQDDDQIYSEGESKAEPSEKFVNIREEGYEVDYYEPSSRYPYMEHKEKSKRSKKEGKHFSTDDLPLEVPRKLNRSRRSKTSSALNVDNIDSPHHTYKKYSKDHKHRTCDCLINVKDSENKIDKENGHSDACRLRRRHGMDSPKKLGRKKRGTSPTHEEGRKSSKKFLEVPHQYSPAASDERSEDVQEDDIEHRYHHHHYHHYHHHHHHHHRENTPEKEQIISEDNRHIERYRKHKRHFHRRKSRTKDKSYLAENAAERIIFSDGEYQEPEKDFYSGNDMLRSKSEMSDFPWYSTRDVLTQPSVPEISERESSEIIDKDEHEPVESQAMINKFHDKESEQTNEEVYSKPSETFTFHDKTSETKKKSDESNRQKISTENVKSVQKMEEEIGEDLSVNISERKVKPADTKNDNKTENDRDKKTAKVSRNIKKPSPKREIRKPGKPPLRPAQSFSETLSHKIKNVPLKQKSQSAGIGKDVPAIKVFSVEGNETEFLVRKDFELRDVIEATETTNKEDKLDGDNLKQNEAENIKREASQNNIDSEIISSKQDIEREGDYNEENVISATVDANTENLEVSQASSNVDSREKQLTDSGDDLDSGDADEPDEILYRDENYAPIYINTQNIEEAEENAQKIKTNGENLLNIEISSTSDKKKNIEMDNLDTNVITTLEMPEKSDQEASVSNEENAEKSPSLNADLLFEKITDEYIPMKEIQDLNIHENTTIGKSQSNVQEKIYIREDTESPSIKNKNKNFDQKEEICNKFHDYIQTDEQLLTDSNEAELKKGNDIENEILEIFNDHERIENDIELKEKGLWKEHETIGDDYTTVDAKVSKEDEKLQNEQFAMKGDGQDTEEQNMSESKNTKETSYSNEEIELVEETAKHHVMDILQRAESEIQTQLGAIASDLTESIISSVQNSLSDSLILEPQPLDSNGTVDIRIIEGTPNYEESQTKNENEERFSEPESTSEAETKFNTDTEEIQPEPDLDIALLSQKTQSKHSENDASAVKKTESSLDLLLLAKTVEAETRMLTSKEIKENENGHNGKKLKNNYIKETNGMQRRNSKTIRILDTDTENVKNKSGKIYEDVKNESENLDNRIKDSYAKHKRISNGIQVKEHKLKGKNIKDVRHEHSKDKDYDHKVYSNGENENLTIQRKESRIKEKYIVDYENSIRETFDKKTSIVKAQTEVKDETSSYNDTEKRRRKPAKSSKSQQTVELIDKNEFDAPIVDTRSKLFPSAEVQTDICGETKVFEIGINVEPDEISNLIGFNRSISVQTSDYDTGVVAVLEKTQKQETENILVDSETHKTISIQTDASSNVGAKPTLDPSDEIKQAIRTANDNDISGKSRSLATQCFDVSQVGNENIHKEKTASKTLDTHQRSPERHNPSAVFYKAQPIVNQESPKKEKQNVGAMFYTTLSMNDRNDINIQSSPNLYIPPEKSNFKYRQPDNRRKAIKSTIRDRSLESERAVAIANTAFHRLNSRGELTVFNSSLTTASNIIPVAVIDSKPACRREHSNLEKSGFLWVHFGSGSSPITSLKRKPNLTSQKIKRESNLIQNNTYNYPRNAATSGRTIEKSQIISTNRVSRRYELQKEANTNIYSRARTEKKPIEENKSPRRKLKSELNEALHVSSKRLVDKKATKTSEQKQFEIADRNKEYEIKSRIPHKYLDSDIKMSIELNRKHENLDKSPIKNKEKFQSESKFSEMLKNEQSPRRAIPRLCRKSSVTKGTSEQTSISSITDSKYYETSQDDYHQYKLPADTESVMDTSEPEQKQTIKIKSQIPSDTKLHGENVTQTVNNDLLSSKQYDVHSTLEEDKHINMTTKTDKIRPRLNGMSSCGMEKDSSKEKEMNSSENTEGSIDVEFNTSEKSNAENKIYKSKSSLEPKETCSPKKTKKRRLKNIYIQSPETLEDDSTSTAIKYSKSSNINVPESTVSDNLSYYSENISKEGEKQSFMKKEKRKTSSSRIEKSKKQETKETDSLQKRQDSLKNIHDARSPNKTEDGGKKERKKRSSRTRESSTENSKDNLKKGENALERTNSQGEHEEKYYHPESRENQSGSLKPHDDPDQFHPRLTETAKSSSLDEGDVKLVIERKAEPDFSIKIRMKDKVKKGKKQKESVDTDLSSTQCESDQPYVKDSGYISTTESIHRHRRSITIDLGHTTAKINAGIKNSSASNDNDISKDTVIAETHLPNVSKIKADSNTDSKKGNKNSQPSSCKTLSSKLPVLNSSKQRANSVVLMSYSRTPRKEYSSRNIQEDIEIDPDNFDSEWGKCIKEKNTLR